MTANLTDLQRATVERIKANVHHKARSLSGCRLGGQLRAVTRIRVAEYRATMAALGVDDPTVSTRPRLAARYASLCRCSLADAAVVFDLNRSSVSDAWREIYPGVPAVKSRRVA